MLTEFINKASYKPILTARTTGDKKESIEKNTPRFQSRNHTQKNVETILKTFITQLEKHTKDQIWIERFDQLELKTVVGRCPRKASDGFQDKNRDECSERYAGARGRWARAIRGKTAAFSRADDCRRRENAPTSFSLSFVEVNKREER